MSEPVALSQLAKKQSGGDVKDSDNVPDSVADTLSLEEEPVTTAKPKSRPKTKAKVTPKPVVDGQEVDSVLS